VTNYHFINVLVRIGLTSASAGSGLALLAQVNCSLWRCVGHDVFCAFHVAWWRSVWWSILPIGALEFAGITAQLIGLPAAPGRTLRPALA
jgi:hypothetical protein